MRTPACTIKHRRPYRTRVKFPSLKNRDDLRVLLREELGRLPKVIQADVRSRSGSVILEHPDGPVSITEVQNLVGRAIVGRKAPTIFPSTGSACPSCVVSSRNNGRKNHVSGPALFFSGLYLLYLMTRNLLVGSVVGVTAVPAAIFSLPALVAFALSLPIQRQALENFKQSGKPDMSLISIGLLYLAVFTGNALAALTVFWLFNLSSWLEDRIRIRTRQAVREMLSDRVTSAWLVRDDGVEIEVAVDSLQPGDVISLRFGSVIPVDGTIIQGQALVNEATLTGESLPVTKKKNTEVLAGTSIEKGDILVRVDKAGEETRLAAIIRLIETAENDPGELQLTSQRFSQAMVPVSLGLAGVAFLISGNLLQAMAVLIITCPCALRLSTSVAVTSAMSRAATEGILIKGGRYIEIAGRVNILVLDKTGTLTDTASEIETVTVIDKRFKQDTVIRLAASAQKFWPHPLSRAVTGLAEKRALTLLPCEQTDLVVGQGVRARIKKDNQEILVGSLHFMKENNISFARKKETLDLKKVAGGSRLYVARGGHIIGRMQTRTRIRGDMGRVIKQLRAIGVEHIVLLTGDHESGIVELEKQYDFDEVHWEQSPEDKAAWINNRKAGYPKDVVAMVGDGINDTPAFAAADLSLAIGGGGADVTVEYADIVLQPGTTAQVGEALMLGRQALRVIKESYALAISLNTATLAATTFGILSPVASALVHNMITFAAVANAAFLRYSRKQPVTDLKNNRLA